MSLRETLNEKPRIVTAATLGIVVIAVIAIVWQLTRSGPGVGGSPSSQAFYTTDDGATLFADDIARIPPFEHRGGLAVRAIVFSCDGRKTRFVGYLERFRPDVAKRLAEQSNTASAQNPRMLAAIDDGFEVKRPGETEWTPIQRRARYLQVTQVECPPGTPGPLEVVLP